MLRIVCIHGNANYSQSEILHFPFLFGGGACPQTHYGAKNLFPHCMPVKFLDHADLPFFIPAGLTALRVAAPSPPFQGVSVVPLGMPPRLIRNLVW